VLLVDTDPQRSAAAWWRSRPADVPELVECDATKLAPVLAAAEEAGVDLLVIDSRPSVEADTGAVAKLADLVLIPTRPAILDLRAIAETVRVVTNAKKPALIVLNATPAARAGVREAAITAEARRALAAYDVPVASVAITSRADLSHALVGGLAVNEFAPNGKAAAELGELFKIVEKALWPKQRARR
jgi:chromosome partitioning protein